MPSNKGAASSAVRNSNSRTSPVFGEDNEDGDLMGLQVPSIPNVYFSYPSASGGQIEQAVETDRPQSGRPKSRSRAPSAKRPTSARKGKTEEGGVKSQFLSFDEAQQMVIFVHLLSCISCPTFRTVAC